MAALGEFSAGRQALEGAAIAPGNMRTLAALTDPSKRPREPRGPLDEDLIDTPAHCPVHSGHAEVLAERAILTKGRCPRPFRDDHGTLETAARK